MPDSISEQPAVQARKAPATIMKEKIAALEAENAALKASQTAPEPTVQAEAPPARSRENTERGARRARGKNDLSHQMKLGVGFELDPNFEYRWINGGLDDQRLFDKTRTEQQGADWQPLMSNGEPTDSTGTVLRRAVGTNQAGQVEYSYCCRKPKDLYDEDAGIIQARNDQRMQAIYRGKATAPGEKEAKDDGLGYQQSTELTGQGRKAIKL